VAAARGRRLHALTVSVADGNCLDEPYATQLVARLELTLETVRPRLIDLAERMPVVIRVLNTFDPMELRNSVVTQVALEAAKTVGIRGVLTGDAADELFAGYSFMFKMTPEQLPAYIRHLNDVMHFTSLQLGPALGVPVELPFLSRSIREFALVLTADDLVGEADGRRFGKKILREAFAQLLPEEITWRVKTPIEFGSGSTSLRQFVSESVADSQFESARANIERADGVRLREKEQYFYYRMYRQIFPAPRDLTPGVKACGECKGPVPRPDMQYCRICGAYPI